MYGTIAQFKFDPARLDELKALGASMGAAPGQVGRYFFQMDGEPGTFYGVAIFKDRESYWANAQSPEQHERYMQLRALMLEDPVWHDGEIIDSTD